jgi:hypothetical protein
MLYNYPYNKIKNLLLRAGDSEMTQATVSGLYAFIVTINGNAVNTCPGELDIAWTNIFKLMTH